MADDIAWCRVYARTSQSRHAGTDLQEAAPQSCHGRGGIPSGVERVTRRLNRRKIGNGVRRYWSAGGFESRQRYFTKTLLITGFWVLWFWVFVVSWSIAADCKRPNVREMSARSRTGAAVSVRTPALTARLGGPFCTAERLPGRLQISATLRRPGTVFSCGSMRGA
jgi:hypothetical protein